MKKNILKLTAQGSVQQQINIKMQKKTLRCLKLKSQNIVKSTVEKNKLKIFTLMRKLKPKKCSNTSQLQLKKQFKITAQYSKFIILVMELKEMEIGRQHLTNVTSVFRQSCSPLLKVVSTNKLLSFATVVTRATGLKKE